MAEIDQDFLDHDQFTDITALLLDNATPDEQIFYERCSVYHGSREAPHFGQNQWNAITRRCSGMRVWIKTRGRSS